jgi:glycosyltransferase involved in cell wall biosynthesis
VGEGPLEHELRDLVRQAGLADRVEFIPLVAQQKLGALYREADVVALVSENEGFGLVLVEAGATGRPVVAARSGGIVDIVEHDQNGLLFTVGDSDGLADALKRILVDRDLRTRLGDGGYARVMADFATPVLVDGMFQLFVSLRDSSVLREAS